MGPLSLDGFSECSSHYHRSRLECRSNLDVASKFLRSLVRSCLGFWGASVGNLKPSSSSRAASTEQVLQAPRIVGRLRHRYTQLLPQGSSTAGSGTWHFLLWCLDHQASFQKCLFHDWKPKTPCSMHGPYKVFVTGPQLYSGSL